MLRLFVGIELPGDVRARLAGLGGGVPGARWTEPDAMHLTLRFIGEVSEDRVPDIDTALSAVEAPAFDLTLDGVGVFGSGRGGRVLWAGVERNDALAHAQAKVESALVRVGLPPEERRFTPHVTLARLREAKADRVGRFLEERGLFRAGPFPVGCFALFVSHLGRAGPVYEVVGEYALAAPARPDGTGA